MKVVRKTEMELGINELKDARIGDILHIDLLNGVTAEFAVIGKDADGADTITIQQITKCKISPFDRKDSNEYDGSDAQKYCTGEWLNNLPEGLRSRVVGTPFLLSKEEVKSGEKYPFYKDARNWLKMNTDGEIDWWWTRSVNRGYGYYVWYVDPSGYVRSYGAAGSSFTLAPACAISVI